MEFIAVQKFIRMSPRKIRLVADMVKDLEPAKAVEVLPHVGKSAATPLIKVVSTAIANAKQKGVSDTELIFREIQINQGPKLKRWRAGARGRAKPYNRLMSHIRVVLETKKENKEVKSVKKDAKTQVKKDSKKTEKKDTKRVAVKKGTVK